MMTFRITKFSVTAFVLCQLVAGCANSQPYREEPGKYADARTYERIRMQSAYWTGATPALNADIKECLLDTIFAQITPAELARLDAFARGEISMPREEYDGMYDKVMERGGGKAGLTSKMAASCPDTVAEADKQGVNLGTYTNQ